MAVDLTDSIPPFLNISVYANQKLSRLPSERKRVLSLIDEKLNEGLLTMEMMSRGHDILLSIKG